jgi:hypothetical protein
VEKMRFSLKTSEQTYGPGLPSFKEVMLGYLAFKHVVVLPNFYLVL